MTALVQSTIDRHGLDSHEHALLTLLQALQEQDYRFTTCTPATHARVNARASNAQADSLAGVFGWSRPFTEALLTPSLLAQMKAAQVLEMQSGLHHSGVRVSSLGDQLLLHSAFPTGAADAVFFGPDSYRFARAIQAFLRQPQARPIKRVADIGCGAGPGALSVALARPDAEVLALDINPTALQYTRVNAAFAAAENVHVQHSNLLNDVSGEFDLIVANPPYMADAERRAYRDGGGELGLGLTNAIVEASLSRLATGGSLLLYSGVAITAAGDPFAAWLQRQLDDRQWCWSYEELDPDVFGEELDQPGYEGVERIAAVQLILTRR